MRVIITGGTGLIGRALAANLAGDGHEAIALSRNPERHADRMPEGVRLEAWDGRTAAGWGALADGADAIVNLAGETLAQRWTSSAKRRLVDSRAQPGQAVVAAVEAATNRPGVVVQASAVGIYGPHGDEPVDEDTPPGDDFAAHVCVTWEAATDPLRALGVRVPVLRTGIVLSGDGGALPRMALPFRLFAGGPVGHGRQVVPWIHLSDVVAAIRFLIERDRADGPYNLAAPNAVTNAEFGRAIGRALGRPSLVPAPAFAMRLLFGEMSTVLLDGQRAVPRRLEEAGFTFRFPDVGPALKDALG